MDFETIALTTRPQCLILSHALIPLWTSTHSTFIPQSSLYIAYFRTEKVTITFCSVNTKIKEWHYFIIYGDVEPLGLAIKKSQQKLANWLQRNLISQPHLQNQHQITAFERSCNILIAPMIDTNVVTITTILILKFHRSGIPNLVTSYTTAKIIISDISQN